MKMVVLDEGFDDPYAVPEEEALCPPKPKPKQYGGKIAWDHSGGWYDYVVTSSGCSGDTSYVTYTIKYY